LKIPRVIKITLLLVFYNKNYDLSLMKRSILYVRPKVYENK